MGGVRAALLALLAASALEAGAAACTSAASGNWSTAGTWLAPCNVAGGPVAGDTVTVRGGHNVTVNGARAAASVQLGSPVSGGGNGTLTFNAGASLTVTGTVTFGNTAGAGTRDGSINMTAGGTLSAGGFAVVSIGTWTPGAGTVVLTATNTLPNDTDFDTFNHLTASVGTTTFSRNVTVNGNLTVDDTLSMAGNTLDVIGNLSVAGTLNVNDDIDVRGTTTVGGTLNISSTTGAKRFRGNVTVNNGGNWNVTVNENVRLDANLTNNGTFTAGGGTYSFEGGALQTLTGTNGGSTSFVNLDLDNGGNNLQLTGTHDLVVTNLLTLTNGVIVTGSNTVYISNGSAIASAGGNDFIEGNLRKSFAAGANVARAFELGTGTTYCPVTVTFASVSVAGDVTVSCTAGSHPQLATSGIDTTTPHKLNRWYTITNSTTAPVSFTTYTAAFTYVAGDIDTGANSAAFIAARYASGAWNPTALSAVPSNTLLTITSETGFGDFAIGEQVGYSVIAGSGARFNAYDPPPATPSGAVNGLIRTKIAGTAFTLTIVHTNAGGTALNNLNANVTIDLLDASPAGGTFTNNCSSNWTTVIATSGSVAFGGGNSMTQDFTVNDAWRNVRVRVTRAGGAEVGCSGDRFAIRPSALTISSTTANNPGSSGTPIIKAGSTFTIDASHPGYAGTTPSINTAPAQIIGSPTAGALSGSFGVAAGGIATGSFTYSEVGNFGLQANTIFDQNFTAVDQPIECTQDFSNTLVNNRYGCWIGHAAIPQTTGSSGFGRFTPDHYFLAASGTLAAGCTLGLNAFTYMGQPMQVDFTLQARNGLVTPTVTQNYAGAYVKLDLATQLGFGALDTAGPTKLTSRTSQIGGSGTFVLGVASVTASLSVNRATPDNPDGPYGSLRIGIAAADADGVTMRGADFDADMDGGAGNDHKDLGVSTTLRFGRLRLSDIFAPLAGNATGHAPVPLQAQYWNGTAFVTNTDDSCTEVFADNFVLYSHLGSVTAGNTPTPTAGAANHVDMALSSSPPGVVLSSGAARVNIKAPNPAVSSPGSVRVCLDLDPDATGDTSCQAPTPANRTYLQGRWTTGNYDRDPNARVGFGVYGAQPQNFIFFRENY
jgi:hypothetical protein